MAGFEFGEELICMKPVKIGSTTYKAGAEFPYQDIIVEMDLVESLLRQRSLIRKSRVTPALLAELKKENIDKIIRNETHGRVAISWPSNEPLPKGVIDGRPGAVPVDSFEDEDEDEDLDNSDDFNEDEDEDEDEIPIVKEEIKEEDHPEAEEVDSVKVVPTGKAGWFNVEVDGIVVNPTKLREKAAEALKKEYS